MTGTPGPTPYVLDAGPMIAFLNDEPGAPVVASLLARTDTICFAHAVNVCEVYYGYLRTAGPLVATKAVQDLLAAGVVLRYDMDDSFWTDMGDLKAAHTVGLGDTFCLALARRLGAELIATDHHELDALAPLGICTITFIR